MYCTGEIMNYLLKKYFNTNKQVVFKVSNKCNIECEHCRENSGPNRDDLISLEVIKKVFDQLDNNWLITLQGGEPSLFLDICKEIVTIAKSKNIPSAFYSNGWWAENNEICKQIFELNTEIIVISINEWTNKIIPIKNANIIADKIKDLPQILIYSECYENFPKFKNQLNNSAHIVEYEIDYCGRAKNFQKKYLGSPLCKRSGFSIEPNGEVFGNCCFSLNGCYFGNINNINLNNLLKRKRLGERCLGREKN